MAEKKAYQVFAKKAYKITFEGKTNLYELSLEESGAFQFGNQKCIGLTKNGKTYDVFDVRYEPKFADAKSFYANIDDFVKEVFADECIIEAVDESIENTGD